jgi:hypothetical protein
MCNHSGLVIVYEMLIQKYKGVQEIIQILQEKPKTLHETARALKEKIGTNWKTTAQCAIRVFWLENLGYLKRNGKFFSLTEQAIGLSEREIEENSLSHKQMQDRIVELGKRVGLIAQKEYQIDNCRLDVVWQRIEEGYPAYIFEIHIGGIFSEALARLKFAWQKFGNPKLYLITNTKNIDRIKNVVRTAYPEIADSIRICDWKDIQTYYESLIGCSRMGEKVRFPILRFRKLKNSPNLLQKLPDLGFEPFASNPDFELAATLFQDKNKKIVSEIIDFIKNKRNVDERTISETFGIDPLRSHIILKFLWKKGYLKRTKRKTDGEWLFSLR